MLLQIKAAGTAELAVGNSWAGSKVITLLLQRSCVVLKGKCHSAARPVDSRFVDALFLATRRKLSSTHQ